MSVKQDLQDQLNQLGVWYPRRATVAELKELLAEANPTTSTAVTEPTAGPTGLCLQCNKPADHKHAGV